MKNAFQVKKCTYMGNGHIQPQGWDCTCCCHNHCNCCPGCIHVVYIGGSSVRTAFLTGRRPRSPVDWWTALVQHLDDVWTTLSNDFLPSIFNHPFLLADYLAYTYSHPRIVQSQLSRDPERHFGLKKKVDALLKFRVLETRKPWDFFYEKEEVL